MNQKFIRKIPLSRPEVDEATVEKVSAVLRNPILSMGQQVDSFESEFAEAADAQFAVAVNSGTSGLHLAVRILGLSHGDEAITSPFSFVASANCLLFEGARPVFVDIDPNTFLMNVDQIESAMSARTKALIPVHIFGNPVEMKRIQAIARRWELGVIEDACEALGGKFEGKALGSWGDFGIFGFYPNKQMTCGEGGMVVTDNERFAQRLKSLRNQGRSPSGDGSFVELGYNYRMSELTAQLGRCQLEQLPSFISSRQQVEERYVSLLSHLEEMRVPPIPKDRSPFVFIVQFKSKELREKVRADLTEKGVQTALYFQPIHLEPFYRGRFHYRPGQFPNAEFAGDTCLALPFYNKLDEVDQKYVAECIEESLVKHRKKSSISV